MSCHLGVKQHTSNPGGLSQIQQPGSLSPERQERAEKEEELVPAGRWAALSRPDRYIDLSHRDRWPDRKPAGCWVCRHSGDGVSVTSVQAQRGRELEAEETEVLSGPLCCWGTQPHPQGLHVGLGATELSLAPGPVQSAPPGTWLVPVTGGTGGPLDSQLSRNHTWPRSVTRTPHTAIPALGSTVQPGSLAGTVGVTKWPGVFQPSCYSYPVGWDRPLRSRGPPGRARRQPGQGAV